MTATASLPVRLSSLGADEKRTLVQRLFTRIAPRYDWFNRLVSCGLDQRWRRAALAQGGIQPGQRVLDVCTGTGDLAMLCAKRQRGQGAVVGIDMNPEMLSFAHRKQRAQSSLDSQRSLAISWLQGDAESLPFSDGSFDRVTIGFSTRNLGNLTTGLREMVRVLKPGGRLIILETGYPSHPVVRIGYQLFLFTFARGIGWLLTGRVWPFTYLARSVREFLTPQQFLERLRSIGAGAEHVPLSGGLASLYLATTP